MTVDYKITPEEYADFNVYTLEHSKEGKRNLIVNRIIPVILIAMIFALIFACEAQMTVKIIMAAVLFLLLIIYEIFAKKIMALSLRRKIAGFLKKGVLSFNKEGRLTFADEGFTQSANDNDIFVSYSEIQSLVILSDVIYIYVGERNALIIPKNCVKEERLESFLMEKTTK